MIQVSHIYQGENLTFLATSVGCREIIIEQRRQLTTMIYLFREYLIIITHRKM